MMLNRFFKKRYPELDWIQVEITSFCNADCIYCPHSAFRTSWQYRHLPLQIFQKLVPAFSRTRLVYLQGWGEPFLHPDFFALLKTSKQAGCRVGTTTNATVLKTQAVDKLVAEGLDVIGFSLAGIDARNDAIRRGTSIKTTLDRIADFQRAKSKYGLSTPKIHVAYMLLRSGLSELEKLPAFLADSGVDQTVVSSLSLVVRPELADEARLSQVPEHAAALQQRLQQIKNEAAGQGVEVHFHLVAPQLSDFVCPENIARSVVVGSDGSISPCVFCGMPVRGENFYYFQGRKKRQQHMRFGNIGTEDFNLIWHRRAYREFIHRHHQGRPPTGCRYCYKGYMQL